MRYIKALCLIAAAAGSAQTASAADYAAVPYTAPVGPAPIVELGSGWYIRGDLGGGFETQVQLSSDTAQKSSQKLAWTGDVGVGYKLNNFLRTDFTFDYFGPQHMNITGKQINCPYNLVEVVTTVDSSIGPAGTGLGYRDSGATGTCQPSGRVDLSQMAVFANVYADLGTYYGITPYVGGGIGAARIEYSSRSDYYQTNDGSAYRADLTPSAVAPYKWIDANGNYISPLTPFGAPLAFSKQNYSSTVTKSTYRLAFNLTGGFAYNVTDQAAIDVNYRYVNNGTWVSLPGSNGAAIRKALETQQVRVGFRYLIN